MQDKNWIIKVYSFDVLGLKNDYHDNIIPLTG